MSNKVKIEKYKDVDIFYDKNTSKLCFSFEGREYERVNYLFEVKDIIDEPRWVECNLEGYFIDGTFSDFVGLAKADQKDIKSGIPRWKMKARYDLEYKYPRDWNDTKTVYLKSPETDLIYEKWKKQNEVVDQEEMKRKRIVFEFKEKKP